VHLLRSCVQRSIRDLLTLRVWVWISTDRGPASGKGSRDSYRASQSLEGPPASRTACGLLVTQFSAQPLIFAAEEERLIAIATVEMSCLKAHGVIPAYLKVVSSGHHEPEALG